MKFHLHCKVECELLGNKIGSSLEETVRVTEDRKMWPGDWTEMEGFEIY